MPRRIALAGAAVLALGAILHPAGRERASMVAQKLSGGSQLTWRDVAVRVLPWSMRQRASMFLGVSPEDRPAHRGATPWIRALDFPLDIGDLPRKSHTLYSGPTGNARSLECHFSILKPGPPAHPPHRHVDEELIIPISGDVEVIRANPDKLEETSVEKTGPLRFIYHAAWLPHTIRAVGPAPATYLVFRWTGAPRSGKALEPRTFDFRGPSESGLASAEPRTRFNILDSPTTSLANLHCHLSTAKPGAAGAPHTDKHDAALVLLSGEIDLMGTPMKAPAVSFHSAGEIHGIKAAGTVPAQYLAFEFSAE